MSFNSFLVFLLLLRLLLLNGSYVSHTNHLLAVQTKSERIRFGAFCKLCKCCVHFYHISFDRQTELRPTNTECTQSVRSANTIEMQFGNVEEEEEAEAEKTNERKTTTMN